MSKRDLHLIIPVVLLLLCHHFILKETYYMSKRDLHLIIQVVLLLLCHHFIPHRNRHLV
jgi:hypothetical protein